MDFFYFTTYCAVIYLSINHVRKSEITIKHYVLEIVRTFIIAFIFHVIDNTFSVFCICPCKAQCVIVKAIFQRPCRQVALGKIIITIVPYRLGILTQNILIKSLNNNIKSMPSRRYISLCGRGYIISNAVQRTLHKAGVVSQ